MNMSVLNVHFYVSLRAFLPLSLREHGVLDRVALETGTYVEAVGTTIQEDIDATAPGGGDNGVLISKI